MSAAQMLSHYRSKYIISSWLSEFLATKERACTPSLHGKKANSENVAVARVVKVHVNLSFCFENDQGSKSFCSAHAKNTAEKSQQQAQLTNVWCAIAMASPQGLHRP